MSRLERRDDDVSLFLRRVRDLIRRAPVTCPAQTRVPAIARLMSAEGVGSIVVVDAAGDPRGIVTDRDLRRKVLAEARDAEATEAGAIMSSPLVTLPPDAFAFEAILAMTRHRIRHVVLVDAGRLVGVVSSQDFFALQSTHPITVAREIDRAPSLEALAALGARITALVSRLVGQGGSAYDVAQLVAELNDRVVLRILALTEAALQAQELPPPGVPYCWLAFGSEGRREQTLRTDQDNGLTYVDPPPEEAPAVAAYYSRFAEQAIANLVSVGFPPCPGNIMASNPRWCQPLSVWMGYFRRWIDHPSPEEVLAACIHFDLRPVAGSPELADALSGIVRTEAPGSRVFLGLLARDVVERRVPITLFGRIAVRGSGPKRGTVDVKGAGALQLVGAARVAALEFGLPQTNTIDRLRAAAGCGLYGADELREITDAYQHLVRLRLVHQLERLAAGAQPDNDLDPAQLSRADALLFRDALKTVERVQAGIRARFSTDLLG